jgi:hypothetical protein
MYSAIAKKFVPLKVVNKIRFHVMEHEGWWQKAAVLYPQFVTKIDFTNIERDVLTATGVFSLKYYSR